VADELRAKMIVDGIWVRSVAESRGDEAKARAIYIGYRVNQLKAEADLNIARDAYYTSIRKKERAEQERERRDRHVRTLDAARSRSFDVVKFGERVFFGLLILAWLVVVANLLYSFSAKNQLTEIVLVFFATSATLFSLARQLPAQNVFLATGIIAFIGTLVFFIGSMTSIPFGPFYYSDNVGPHFKGVPWITPFVWVIAILNSRGVARLILRPWRKTLTYGWWVIGFTIVLCVLMDLGWEVFAARVKHYVFWTQTRFPVTWYGIPLVNFLGWILTLLLILAFATPALINKNPSRTKSKPDYSPLIVWMLLNAIFLTGAAAHQLWASVIVTGASCVIVTVFAVRGARW